MLLRSSIFDLRSSIRRLRSAFTIVELMISIAMVVILMVGIHQIFKMTSDTVGMGHSLADNARANRSVQSVFHDDYQRLMKDAPLFIIRSGVAGAGTNWGAFTTEAERSADRDGDPLTQDLDGNGQEGQPTVNGELTPVSIYNNRNHRVDVLGFPAHGLFHRHTANDGSYSSPMTSQDAFIFYEHVRLPTNGPYFDPGEPAVGNLNNSLASQWILGRVALLMRDPPMTVNGAAVPDNFVQRNFSSLPLSPLHYKSLATGPGAHLLTDSRYDLLGASLETLRQDVADVRTNVGTANFDYPTSIWWQPLIYRRQPAPPPVNSPVTRFDCNPRISKPITSEAMAKAMPVLLPNCSQFAVEYAGDFLTQDNRQFIPDPNNPNNVILNPRWGQVTGIDPDGVIDYLVDFSNAPNPPVAGTVSAKIRWYGLPRDTNGDRVIPGAGWKGSNVSSNDLVDVVPLRDVMLTARDANKPYGLLFPSPPANFAALFEREVPLAPPGGDYVSGMLNASAGAKAAFRYTCVWVNGAPTMLRIVVKLEDPAGRLPEGQWFEYVVGAP